MEKGLSSTYLLLVLATSIWGGAFIAGKISTETLDPVTVAFFRFLGASLILFPLMWWKESNRPKRTKKDWFTFAFLGLTGICLYNLFFFFATKHAPIIKSSLVIASNPVLIVILSALFLKEKISLRHVIGMVSAIVGVLYIITNGNIAALAQIGFAPIDFVLLGACLTWALYTVVGKFALRKFSPLVTTTYATGFGTLMLFPFAMVQTKAEHLVASGWEVWLAVIYVAIFVSVISFIWWYQGVQRIGAAKSSIFINVMPISATIMAAVFLDEQLSVYHAIGALLVFSGVYLSMYKSQKSIAAVAPQQPESTRG
jgi:drug/metabolite transporter (DMT)-like permease